MRNMTNSIVSFMAGIAVGAGTEYLLDPDTGHRRRRHLGGQIGERIGGLGESISHRMHDARSSASSGMSHHLHAAGAYIHGLRDRMSHRSDSHDEPHAVGPATLFAAALGAVGLGAVLMYALDPNMGNRRRKMAADQLRGRIRSLQDEARRKAKYARGHLKGYAHDARNMLRREQVSDEQLRERIRSRLGHVSNQAGQITVDVHEGHVVLRGTVGTTAAGEILSTVRATHGVQAVEDQLQRS